MTKSVVLNDDVVSHVGEVGEVEREDITSLLVHEVLLVRSALNLNTVVLLAVTPDDVVLIVTSGSAILAQLLHDARFVG